MPVDRAPQGWQPSARRTRSIGGWVGGVTVALLLLVTVSLPNPSVGDSGPTQASPGLVNLPTIMGESIATFDSSGGSSIPVLVAAGDTIVVLVSAHYKTSVTGVTDSAGDVYASYAAVSSGSSASLAIWVAADAVAAPSLVVSVTLSRSAPSLLAVAVVGGASGSPVDVVSPGATGADTNSVQVSLTTTAPGDLVLLGISVTGNPSVTAPAGLAIIADRTETAGATQQTGAVLATPAPTSGDLTLTARISTNEYWAADAIAIKPAVGSSPPGYPVSGAILSSKGPALGGAMVSTEWNGTPVTGFSGPQGSYQISLPNGTYVVTVTAAGFLNATQSVTVSGTPQSGVNFTLMPVPSGTLPGNGTVQHAVVIYLENEPIANVWALGPYERYLASQYSNASQFYGACHPSVPNYLASTAGVDYGCGSDAYHKYSIRNLPDLLEERGLSWAGYFENMSSPCDLSNNQTYVIHHNPFLYYSDIVRNATNPDRCSLHDLPGSDWGRQLATETLLNYSFYAPNTRDSGENSTVTFADQWLKGFLTPLINATNPALEETMNHTVFFILYDESKTSDTSGFDGTKGGHVFFVAVSPFSHQIVYSSDASDYSLLSTIEWLFGLGSTGHKDGTSQFPAMKSLFQFA